MVIAYHVILTMYGFWLPNDPRGSWSTEVWARDLRPFGPATKVDTHRSVAHRTHDRTARREAKNHLAYPAVRLTGIQAKAIADGFSDIIGKLGVTVHACAIMPDHAHLVVSHHRMLIEEVAEHLKRAGTRQLNKAGVHPLAAFNDGERTPCPWAAGGRYVFLNSPDEVVGRVQYVEQNPVKAGLRRQKWSMVVAYDGKAPRGERKTPRGRGG